MAGVHQGPDRREADRSKKKRVFSGSGSATKLNSFILLFIFAGVIEERTSKAVRAARAARTATDAVNRMTAFEEAEEPEPKADEPESPKAQKVEAPESVQN